MVINFNLFMVIFLQPILNELSIWVHPMVSYMKFSAYGFFTIDYNMLCGFMTALITYLVIFIQFYALNGQDSVSHIVRGGGKEEANNDHSIRDMNSRMMPID